MIRWNGGTMERHSTRPRRTRHWAFHHTFHHRRFNGTVDR
nr:MAG TPA: hypothetical protein [Caudoviricetes sp.]